MTDMTQAPTPGPLMVGDYAVRLEDHPLVKSGEVHRVTEMFRGGYLGFTRPVGGEWNPSGWRKCDADGWMPWSGGENPTPGQKVEWKSKAFTGTGEADRLTWSRDHLMPIIAFRLAPTAPVEASGSERDDPDFWCRLMGEALDALDIIASDEPWSDGATSAVFAEKASATIRAKYSDLSSEPHDERRGGYDRSDVRYGLQLIADEECDEVAAAYYAKKALAALRPQPSGETR